MFSEFCIDGPSGGSVRDVFVFVHKLALNLERNRVVVHDLSNHVVRGLFGGVVTVHLSALVESWFEKVGSQLPLASLANLV
jgi:hypothetical protein